MEIKNAKIVGTSISMADHGCLSISIAVVGDTWACNIGGWRNGVGHLGAKEWRGNGSAIVAMMKIMDIVGVDKWENLTGKCIRVKLKELGGTIDEIGSLIEDRWFNLREFYKTDIGQATFILKEGEEEEE